MPDPDDDQLWDVHRGDQPLLATAIHDGHGLRREVADRMALSDDGRRREEDPATGRWTTMAANRIIARRSRFEVDLNRPPESAVYRTPDDAWGLDVWQEGPDAGLIERSLGEYRAFHELTRALLTDVEQQFGPFVVFDLHSYNHRRDGEGAPPADPDANPVVNVGTGNIDRERWAPVVDRFLADLGAEHLLGEAIDVRENVRFRGGHFSRWVTETFPRNGCVLAVEVKKVYMDEWSGEIDDDACEQVGRALRATVPGIIDTLGDL